MAGLYGTFTKYPFYTRSGIPSSDRSLFLLEADANVNIKLLTDKYTVVPYMTLGVGASMYGGTYFAAQGNTGVGLQVNLGSGTFLNTQMLYRPSISELSYNHTAYTIGIASPIGGEKPEPVKATPPPPPAPAPAPVDTDKDGINDKDDKCPTVAGVAKYNGCPVPDTDKDGINDENDKCPTVAGVAKYNGCPVPDTDKDGVNDEEDKCPTVAGLARYQGCPIPDTDKDGVNDEEDKCPKEAGVAANKGCPEIEKQVAELAKSVYFPTGSTTVGKEAAKTLDAVVEILNKYTDTKLNIEGHTDNVGQAAHNQALSTNRAKSVYNYLVEKGIARGRLEYLGLGMNHPVADNNTVEGRAKNRRTEIIIL